MLLTNARVAQGPLDATLLDIEIESGRIRFLSPSSKRHASSPEIDLSGMLILPGLVNAHDHLEFAIFPRMGNRVYANAREWALDIYHPDQSPVRELLEIPKATRLFWGGLKNLLCGVTTVGHHNRYEAEVFEGPFPVRVLNRFGWSHSIEFSQDLRADFAQTPEGSPFFIHLGEGTDESSRDELQRLDSLGLLNPQTVIIHGVACTAQDWELVRDRGAGLVWCPTSNLFILGQTPDLSLLPSNLKIALGNDSPLTAAGDLLDEIRLAHQLMLSRQIPPYQGGQAPPARGGCPPGSRLVPPSDIHHSQADSFASLGEQQSPAPAQVVDPAAELYSMVTTVPAHLMGLNQGQGAIVEDGVADFLAVKDTGESPSQRLVQLSATDIELVVLGGDIMLASTLMAQRLPHQQVSYMRRITYDQRECFVSRDIEPHRQTMHSVLHDRFCVAGKSIGLGGAS
jgi:cytosine/adenosine deaminase-related metal-dependent hydrolase